MLPRIIDIAKAANVSPFAVSLALNNKAGVSVKVRQRISAVAAKLERLIRRVAGHTADQPENILISGKLMSRSNVKKIERDSA